MIAPWRDELTIGVEATFNWYWFVDACREYDLKCYLGHSLYIKEKAGGKHKSDKIDSSKIGDLLRQNSFPLAYAYPPGMRSSRNLLRRRLYWVRRRCGAYIHTENIFYQMGITPPSLGAIKRQDRRKLLTNITDEDLRMNVEANFDCIDQFDKVTDKLEKYIKARVHVHDARAFSILLSMPGLGDYSALTIIYEMHTVERFRTVGDFSSYSRVVRAQCDSGGKRVGGGRDKVGNPNLKWAFSEIALHIVQYSEPVKRWYDKQIRKKGKAKHERNR